MVLGNHGTDLGVDFGGVTDLERAGSGDDAFDELLADLAAYVGTLDTGAGLSRVGEAAPDRTGDGEVDVGVLEHEHRILAAEFEHAALHQLGAFLADLVADRNRSGEEDLLGA